MALKRSADVSRVAARLRRGVGGAVLPLALAVATPAWGDEHESHHDAHHAGGHDDGSGHPGPGDNGHGPRLHGEHGPKHHQPHGAARHGAEPHESPPRDTNRAHAWPDRYADGLHRGGPAGNRADHRPDDGPGREHAPPPRAEKVIGDVNVNVDVSVNVNSGNILGPAGGPRRGPEAGPADAAAEKRHRAVIRSLQEELRSLRRQLDAGGREDGDRPASRERGAFDRRPSRDDRSPRGEDGWPRRERDDAAEFRSQGGAADSDDARYAGKAVRYFVALDKHGDGQVNPDEWSASRRIRPAFEAAGVRLDDDLSADAFLAAYLRVFGR